MDNSINRFALLLMAALDGRRLPTDDKQFLQDCLATLFPMVMPLPDSADFQKELDQFRRADQISGFSRPWRSRFAQGRTNPALATAFIQSFMRDLVRPYRLAKEQWLVCGTTVTEAHSVMDYTTLHAADASQWVLHWTSEGEYLLQAELQQLIGVGEFLLIPPLCRCEYQRSPASECWTHHWVRFVPDTVWLNWCAPLQSNSRLFKTAAAEPHYTAIDSAFRDMERFQYHEEGRLAANRLEFLLLLLVDSIGDRQAPLDDRIQRALAFVGDNYAREWSVPQLADHCNLSAPRLAGLFRQQLGLAPMQWRDKLRMQEACKMLRDTRNPVAEIGSRVGYDDPLHFSRRFRQLVGCSPRAYRREQSSHAPI